MLTQDFIEQTLINGEKRIVRAEKQQMWPENRHHRNDFYLESYDGKYTYRVFLRRSDEFMEDFSVGLVWTNATNHIHVNRDIVLLRCQGPHDSGKPLGTDIHHSYHTHEVTVKDIMEHRYLKPSSKGITDAFACFQSALSYFVKRCGVSNSQGYADFKMMNQISLLDCIGGESND